MAAAFFFKLIFLMVVITNHILCADIDKTDIKIVNDENSYMALHPDETYKAFESISNAKGNIFFKIGERISGDNVILTYLESISYTRPLNAEISIRYPADGQSDYNISCIEFITDFTTKEAAAYLVGSNGGILKRFAETLLVANQTTRFGYQLVIYGF